MKLIERYIFMRAASAFVMTVIVLCSVLWLTQALREMDLMTSKGQTILIFLSMTSLVLPTLVMVIAPFALMIAITYTLNTLNSDSELVVINATSAPPWVVVKPLIVLATIATILGGYISLDLNPTALNTLRNFISQVRADLVANVVKEGIFTEIEKGMTFHIQKREPNGIMRGLFLSDERDSKKHIVYSSEFAQIIENEDGTFLKMDRGTIQQQEPIEASQQNQEASQQQDEASESLLRKAGFQTVNIINFDSYAIDLSQFTGQQTERVGYYKAREFPTSYLLNPNIEDKWYARQIGKARSELHDRFTNPLYNLAFAAVIVAFLTQVRTTRERRGNAIFIAVSIASLLRLAGFAMTSLATQTPFAVPAMYALPLIAIVVCLWIAITGRRLDAVDDLIRLMELLSERARQKMEPVFKRLTRGTNLGQEG